MAWRFDKTRRFKIFIITEVRVLWTLGFWVRDNGGDGTIKIIV